MVKKGEKIKRQPRKLIAQSGKSLDNVLVENFVNLQRVLTNLSVKFDELSNNISKLLQLFEISAKSFAGKNADDDLSKKLDTLLDQNKTIAKGLVLMEERSREKAYGKF